MNVEIINSSNPTTSPIACGNCWGHQEWKDQQTDKPRKRITTNSDGFILKFVKKYL